MSYDQEKINEVLNCFSCATDVKTAVIDREANLISTVGQATQCDFCKCINKILGTEDNCSKSHLYGSHQAQRFGGKYIFFCHLGLAHFASPIVYGGFIVATLIGGPVLMIEPDEYFTDDILSKYDLDEQDISELREYLARIPYASPEKVRSLSELMFVCAKSLGDNVDGVLPQYYENQKLQGIISEYIMRIKSDSDKGFYPLEKEDELLDAMSKGDVKAARALLNELLGYIFFYSGFQFDVIRSRVLELIVLLSRAAVRGGADAELIFGLNYEYLKEIDMFDNVESMADWLSKIMNRFTDYVFNFADIKHVDIIYKSTNYINANYMKKITLEEVAGNVYLSPAYFSKLFKEEVKSSFTTYLNKVRIEQSKKLLRNNNINLADISNMVGYEDQSYFSKVFKKMTGMSPLKFRQSRK